MLKSFVLQPDATLTERFRLGIMAAAVRESRVSAGKKLKNSLKKKGKMKMISPAAASELEDKDTHATDNEGNVLGLSFAAQRKGRHEFAGSRVCECTCR